MHDISLSGEEWDALLSLFVWANRQGYYGMTRRTGAIEAPADKLHTEPAIRRAWAKVLGSDTAPGPIL